MPVDETIQPTSGTAIKAGGVRLITTGEIALARKIYGYNLWYNKIWIHRNSYLPFNLQPDDIAMSPDGEMWFREETYSVDFSREHSLAKKHRFMHEMMHVWQHQHGMFVRTRGLFSRFADYYYSLDRKNLLDYGLEQQASIVSDYWLLLNYGFFGNNDIHKYRDYHSNESIQSLIAKYKKILKGFPG